MFDEVVQIALQLFDSLTLFGNPSVTSCIPEEKILNFVWDPVSGAQTLPSD